MHFNHVLSNFSVISVFTETGVFPRLHYQFTDINISGQCSKKHANSCLFLKKEFAELQIRLYGVQNMSLEGSASKLDAGVVTAFSPMIWRNSAELRAHFSYSFLSCQE